jgi:RNA polymerase sigma factor (sigma-70 family)
MRTALPTLGGSTEMSVLSDLSPDRVDGLLTAARAAEDSLFARARAGEDGAWEELFRKCYPKVIRAVRRKLNDPKMRALFDSTDFASEVMKSLTAKKDRWTFETLGSLIAFLEHVAEQKVYDEYRRYHASKRHLKRHEYLGAGEGGGVAALIASVDPTPSQEAVATEAQERLLDGLDPTRREIFELKRLGHTNAEIARRVGWNIRRVQRFLEDLRESYQQSSGD